MYSRPLPSTLPNPSIHVICIRRTNFMSSQYRITSLLNMKSTCYLGLQWVLLCRLFRMCMEQKKYRQVTCLVNNHTIAQSSSILLLQDHNVKCALRYLPVARPIGRQYGVTPWPVSIHILNTLQNN
jgi:hypothetical protein